VHGKSLRLAVDDGFLHAMNAIVDSNVSTILTALILYASHRPGARLRHHVDYRYHRIDDLGDFRRENLVLIWLNRRPDMVT